jgi:hypothetical protein
MSTHNYTAETYNGNLQILNNSISRINQTILPSDPISQFSMGYSVEIASFNSVLSDLQEICVKAISAYEGVKNKVCENDANSANGLVDSINDIEKLKSAFLSITEIMKNNVICYVGYNPETYQYEIDKKKLSELLQKENLTEAEKATLENTLKLSVDENGQVNEKYLETFLSCCYKKDYKVDNVDLNSVYPVYGGRAYNYDYYARNGLARLDVDSNPAYNYDYYATYSRNGNLEEILVRLDQDKYKEPNQRKCAPALFTLYNFGDRKGVISSFSTLDAINVNLYAERSNRASSKAFITSFPESSQSIKSKGSSFNISKFPWFAMTRCFLSSSFAFHSLQIIAMFTELSSYRT